MDGKDLFATFIQTFGEFLEKFPVQWDVMTVIHKINSSLQVETHCGKINLKTEMTNRLAAD